MYFDPTYILMIPAIIFSFYAQFKVKSAYSKYSRLPDRSGLTGAEVARRILDANGLYDVKIAQVAGELTDHYDPSTRQVRLSEGVYDKRSIAAISVAAHETGHAIQHAQNYAPLSIRSTIVPIVNLASKLSWPLIIIGLIIMQAGSASGGTFIFDLGIIFFLAVILFHTVTLPVEFNASSRALAQIEALGIVTDRDEMKGARSMLSAAAMTYVAALAVALANLLRILALRRRR